MLKCPVCGGEEFKEGQLMGKASVQPMNSNVNLGMLGGSELILTFCAQCGEVVRQRVRDPKM